MLPRLRTLNWAPARGTLVLSGAALLAGMTVLFGWIDWLALGRWARPNAVPLALFVAAGTGMVAAGWRLRGQHAPRTRASGLSWWVVVAAAIVVVVVAWVATNWLLGEASAAKDAGAARVDAIKTGLGIGAGTTGIFALLLAVRRQWHSESDATEKNVTELYTKAADQLGSAEAPVRLAGLYALERLAHNNPGQRQSIVNVICAYLRMPYTPPGPAPATDGVEHQERTQEREVRLAGQRILTDHLDPQNHRKFWQDIDLDLTNAHLIDFVLPTCRLRRGRFTGATFSGVTSFSGATFTDSASFGGAAFTNEALFCNTKFSDEATFGGATFTDRARFDGAAFTGFAWFGQARFTGFAMFDGATYAGEAWFSDATFADGASFDGATFTRYASFDGATFTNEATFDGATFTCEALFRGVNFICDTSFDGATFAYVASFGGVNFAGDASFRSATFTGETAFEEANFTGYAQFDDTTFKDIVWFDGATFTGPLPTIDQPIAERASFEDVIITSHSRDRATGAGIVVDVLEMQVIAEEMEPTRGDSHPLSHPGHAKARSASGEPGFDLRGPTRT